MEMMRALRCKGRGITESADIWHNIVIPADVVMYAEDCGEKPYTVVLLLYQHNMLLIDLPFDEWCAWYETYAIVTDAMPPHPPTQESHTVNPGNTETG